MTLSESDSDGHDESVTTERLGPGRRVLGVVLAVVLFGLAMGTSLLVERVVTAIVDVGRPGTVSELVSGVVALQIVGFGGASLGFLATRERDWRSYLRLGPLSDWTLFYAVAVGLGLMVLTSVATLLFTLLAISPPESSVGQATGPEFYVVLLVVSTLIVVPAEELFFRGVVQRYLSEMVHPAVGIAVASLFFAAVHAGVAVGSGGELLSLLLFVSFGFLLGGSYHLRENLLVPVIGHGVFNGVQIFVRTLEVLA